MIFWPTLWEVAVVRSKTFWDRFAKFAMPALLACVIVGMQLIRSDANLLSPDNIKTIFLQTSVLGFLALGLTFVMIAGESDISFAGTLGMMSTIFTMLINAGVGYFPAVLIVVLLGMAIGFMISFVVTRFGFSAFIVSIAVMFMGLGIERSFNEGITIWLQNEQVLGIGHMQVGGFFLLGWEVIILYAAALLVVQKTHLGFKMRIVGENRFAAMEAGVPDKRIKILSFVIAGAMFALASTTEPIRFGGSIVGAGQSYMLPALSACYLGSTMFKPGRVNVGGTFVGALFMICVSNFMTLLSAQYYFTPLVQGLILILAVGMSCFKTRATIQQVKI